MKIKSLMISFSVLLLTFTFSGCGGNGKEKKAADARQSVKEQVTAISQDLPVAFKGGYRFESVSVDDRNNVVRYLYKIDASQVKYFNFLNEKDNLEAQLRRSLSSEDEEVRKFIQEIEEAGLDIVYRYEFSDGNVLEIKI